MGVFNLEGLFVPSLTSLHMALYEIVCDLLKARGRSKIWLAKEIDMTFDGMKLALIRQSMKFNDLVKLSKILEISPAVLFDLPDASSQPYAPPTLGYSRELKTCEEMLKVCKSQLKDKELIIELLTKQLNGK